MKNKQDGYHVDVSYDATGYHSGITSRGMTTFDVLAGSFGGAYDKAMKMFEEWSLVRTRCKDSGYYGLDYTVKDVDIGKRVLNRKI